MKLSWGKVVLDSWGGLKVGVGTEERSVLGERCGWEERMEGG